MDQTSQEFYKLSFDERQKARKAADAKVTDAANKVDELARRIDTPARQLVRVWETRLKEVESSSERDGGVKQRHIAMIKRQLKEARDKQQLEQRAADFAADPLVKLAGQTFESVSRSGEHLFPGSSAEDRALLVALWQAKEKFATPKEFLTTFHQTYDKIAQDSFNHLDRVAKDKAHESLKVASESAAADLEAAKAKGRLSSDQ